MSLNIFWLRRDLRLFDNHGLSESLKSNTPTLCVFIFDPNILDKLPLKDDRRVQFIYQTLEKIKADLEKKGSSLLVIHDTPINAFKQMIKDYDISAVYTNHDYEPYAIARDLEIQNFLSSKKISFFSYKDQCIFERTDILKDDGKPYTVFTPYMKKWISRFKIEMTKAYEIKNHFYSSTPLKMPSLKSLGFSHSDFKYPTTSVSQNIIINYDKDRDFPYKDGTSLLGLHLRFGTVSIRQLVKIAQQYNKIWLSELIWRDFFMQILWHFPEVTQSAFKPQYDDIQWLNDAELFKAWCNGMTGYPLVDAGMRELNQTGHMHNRVRMLTASFLTKHLLIDWRKGEKYFAERLLDFDLSANNGNWQWAAGCGCDAAPYFRIFNPEIQQKKFDPDFKYIKKWVPEFGTHSYPKPIVNHEMARERTLSAYKKALKS